MPQKILTALCLTIILSLSFSVSAWSQLAPSPPLSPAAIKVRQEINTVSAKIEVLKQQRERMDITKRKTTLELENFYRWEEELGISAESFPEIIKSLQSERIDLTIDLAGLTAKRTAILSAQKEAKREPNKSSIDKTLLANSLLETSLELAEKKARQASIKSLLANYLSARKNLDSINALRMKSKIALGQEIEITDKYNRSTLELDMLREKQKELMKN